MYYILIIIILLICFGLWCCLKAASIQDNDKK